MKKTGFLSLAVATGLLAPGITAVHAGDFRLVKEDATVSLYERWIPGGDEEGVREIKAVFYARTDATSVIRLLQDQRQGLKWNNNAGVYQVTAAAADSWTTYIRYDLPWPMDDQDCCLTHQVRHRGDDNKILEILFEGKNDPACPVKDNVVRVTGVRGRWIVEPRGTAGVKITYIITSDRSTTMPRWISDPIVHKNIFRTLTAFKNILETQSL